MAGCMEDRIFNYEVPTGVGGPVGGSALEGRLGGARLGFRTGCGSLGRRAPPSAPGSVSVSS